MAQSLYHPPTLSPLERVQFDTMRADLEAEKARNERLENALLELAELIAAHDDGIVELAEE